MEGTKRIPLDERPKRTASDIPVTLRTFELLLSDYVESHHRVFGNNNLQRVYPVAPAGTDLAVVIPAERGSRKNAMYTNSCGQLLRQCARRAGTL